MTEREWKEPIQIPDGTHSGEIVRIEERIDPYEYTDIVIKPDGIEVELRYGCPSILSENSKLGRVMQNFGSISKPGTKVDPQAFLKGKRCVFMTMMKKSKDGKEYAEIVPDSLKLGVETQKVG